MYNQKLSQFKKIITYGLATGLAMSLGLLLAKSGPLNDMVWPKFLVPLTTFLGIYFFLYDRRTSRPSGLKYFKSLVDALRMSVIAFFAFSGVLFFSLTNNPPEWMTHLKVSPLWVTVFSTLAGIVLSMVLVLILLPAFKRKQTLFKEENREREHNSSSPVTQ